MPILPRRLSVSVSLSGMSDLLSKSRKYAVSGGTNFRSNSFSSSVIFSRQSPTGSKIDNKVYSSPRVLGFQNEAKEADAEGVEFRTL